MTSEHFAAQTPLNFGVTWIGEALSTVRAYCNTLNSLNAFPVPDQDTGSNLVYTLDALNKAFSEGLDTLLHDLHALTTDIQSVNQRLGKSMRTLSCKPAGWLAAIRELSCAPGGWRQCAPTGIFPAV